MIKSLCCFERNFYLIIIADVSRNNIRIDGRYYKYGCPLKTLRFSTKYLYDKNYSYIKSSEPFTENKTTIRFSNKNQKRINRFFKQCLFIAKDGLRYGDVQ